MISFMRMAVMAVMAAVMVTVPVMADERNLQLFVITYQPGPNWDHSRPLMEQSLRPHGEYMSQLFRDGSLLAAGPLFEPEGGLVILQAARLEEAEAMMAADPAVQTGLFEGRVQEWRTRFVADAPLPVTLR
jgi:uncharacterized protein YciI